jgi:hypothetical protein
VVVVAAEEEDRRHSRLHLVVRLLVAIFLVDVASVVNGSIDSILLRLVLRKVGILKKDGVDLETDLREMSLPEVRVGIIVVNEISSLEVCSFFYLLFGGQ